MVVVLPEPLTPTTRMTNGFARRDHERLRHRRQYLLDLGGQHRLHLVRRDRLVVAAFAHRRSRSRPAVATPRSARISTSSSSSIIARHRACAWTRGPRSRRPIEDEVRLSPPVSRCHQLAACRLGLGRLGAVVHAARRDSGFDHDTGRDGVPPALPRWPDAGDRQAGRLGGASRAEGRREPGGPFRRAALRAAARARARPPARPRHLGLPGARPPPQGARRARPAVQEPAASARPTGPWWRAARRPRKAASTCRSAGSTRPAAGG